MGKGHYPPPKPPKPVNPGPVNPNPGPSKPGVPLIWWTENEQGRLTDAEKANVGIATLIIQRDSGTLWRVGEDKPPYTWTQIATGDATKPGDPYNLVDPNDPNFKEIKPWDRVIVAFDGPLTVQVGELPAGQSFEIVDAERDFDKQPVTLVPPKDMNFPLAGPGNNLVLDQVGQGTVWRFTAVADDIVVAIVP